jgi:hypothetical protein
MNIKYLITILKLTFPVYLACWISDSDHAKLPKLETISICHKDFCLNCFSNCTYEAIVEAGSDTLFAAGGITPASNNKWSCLTTYMPSRSIQNYKSYNIKFRVDSGRNCELISQWKLLIWDVNGKEIKSYCTPPFCMNDTSIVANNEVKLSF